MRTSALALLLVGLTAAPSRADWQVKRSPFDATLVAREKQLLRKDPDDLSTLKKLVEQYRKYRSIDQLKKELADSHTPEDLVVLGHLARQQGKLDEAARRYREALDAGETCARPALAAVALEQKRFAEARTLYDAAIAQAGSDGKKLVPLYKKRIEVELADPATTAKDRLQSCRPLYEKLLQLQPNDESLEQQLAELEAANDPASAARLWLKIADRRRGDPSQRGQALLNAGQYQEAAEQHDAALKSYEEVYALAPKDHFLRREAMARIIEVHRKKDDLRALADSWEQKWPKASRGFFEWEALAGLWDELGDAARAEDALKHALAIDSHQIETRRRLIALYERAGRSTEAIAELRKLVQSAPGEPRFRLELAERLWKSEPGSTEAVKLAHAVAAETRDPSVHQQLADLYSRWSAELPAMKLEADVLVEREKLVRLEPNEESHLVNLGELYFARGQKDKALEIWKKLLTLKGEKREKLEARLGDVYAEHDLPNEALEAYQHALKLAPDDLTIQKGMASALERVHRDAEAETLWEQLYERASAQKNRSLALEVRQRLLGALLRLNRLNTKLPLFRQKLELATDDEARATWGLLAADGYLRLSRPEAAETMFRELVKRLQTPELRGEAYVGLAQVLKSRRRYQEAVSALESAAQLLPGRARELYAQIAELSLQLYRDADALTFAKKSVELGPGDAAAHLRLAEVLEKRDQIDEAANEYARALELNDRQWKLYFVLARLELRRGRYADAAKLYRQVIRRAPEEELVVDAARRAIDLDEYLGSLGELERELSPLSYAHPDRRVYRDLLVDLYARYVPPLSEQARHGDASAQKELSRLGEHGLRPLLEALTPPDDATATNGPQRRAAAVLLGELGNASATEPLLKLAERPKPTSKRASAPIELRVEASVSAARLATVHDAPALAQLADDPEKLVRSAALWGLGRLPGNATAEAALDKALADSSGEALALACIGLGRMRSTRGALAMIDLVHDRNRPELARAGCAVGLGALADKLPDKLKTQARTALVDLLSEGSDAPQEKAAWALGRLDAQKSLPSLLQAVFVRNGNVRLAAIDALAGAPEPRFGEPGRAALADGGGLDVRGWVQRLATAHAPSPPSLALRDHEEEVAHAVDDALSRHRDLQLRTLADLDARSDGLALGPLTTGTLTDGDRAALQQIGERLRPRLERLAQAGGDTLVRAAAVKVLGKVRGALPTVLKAVSDGAPEVRLAALEALALAPPEASEAAPLVSGRALDARDWRERRAALFALPPSAAATAARALDDADGFVREAAARALAAACARSPSTSALDALTRHAGDEASRVRAAVAAALTQTRAPRPPQVRATLDRLRRDPDPEVRAAVGD